MKPITAITILLLIIVTYCLIKTNALEGFVNPHSYNLRPNADFRGVYTRILAPPGSKCACAGKSKQTTENFIEGLHRDCICLS